MVAKIKIDPEFSQLIPATSAEEDAEFERAVLADGRIFEPLIVWEHQGILLDGHRRNRLLTRHPSLPAPKPIVLKLESRQEAHDWIIHHQLSKRNVTDAQRRYLIGKLYRDTKAPPGRPSENNVETVSTLTKTAEEIAEIEGVTARTVRNDAAFSEAVDAVAEVAPEVKAAVLAGDVKATTKDLEAMAGLPPKKAEAAARKITSGEAKTVKAALPKKQRQPKNGREVGAGLKREVLKDLGKVKRGLDSLKIYASVKPHVEAIHKAIQGA